MKKIIMMALLVGSFAVKGEVSLASGAGAGYNNYMSEKAAVENIERSTRMVQEENFYLTKYHR